MSYNWASYRGATGCDSSDWTGSQALKVYLMDRFPQITSTGICSCRSVNGGSSWSHHAECRALDAMLPTGAGGSAIPAFGDPIIELLGPHGRELGIDHDIWNRKIWSNSSPNGRVYTGSHPHYNHHHIGLTRGASNNLTYATLVKVLGPADPENPTIPIPGGSKLSLLPIQYGHGFTKPPADSGLSGDQSFKKEDVKLLQMALGQAAPQDGIYGNGTSSDVKAQTSSTDGKLVGDVDFDEAVKVAGAITPVPGGVGPMTIACLLANTIKARKSFS